MKRSDDASSPPAFVERATEYGWMPLLALASTQMLESGERMVLAQAVEGIQGEFGISDVLIGFLPFSMAFVGALGSIPIGILSDRMRRTWLLMAAMLIWTVAIGFMALTTSIAMLLVLRMILGAVEANAPAAVSLISDYYPVRTRARMLGLYSAGGLIGALFGLMLGGLAVKFFGWRWAFAMWVPAGLAVVIWLWTLPEPRRGDRDRDFERDLETRREQREQRSVDSGGASEAFENREIELPAPHRVGNLDYAQLTQRQAFRELIRIRSLWFAIIGLGMAQMLLQGLSFWAVEFFRRAHDLGSAAAGGLAGGLALGAAAGVIGGGFIADRLFDRGLITARVWVTGLSAVGAAVVMVPAFASPSLLVTALLMILGGFLITMPMAPSDAMLNDVVVSQLRGRALTLRSVVRSVGMVGPVIIGALSNAIGLQAALVVFTPTYAVGGLIVLVGLRYYPQELSFVVAESRRERVNNGYGQAAQGNGSAGVGAEAQRPVA